MEKRIWTKPQAVVENFEVNEYIAACGDIERVAYNFQCNAPAGNLYYYNTKGEQVELGAFTPNPNAQHTADSDEYFPDGFIDYNKNRVQDEGEAVRVWIEYGQSFFGSYIVDYHATKELDMTKWETAKS